MPSTPKTPFKDLPLHDAVLKEIRVDWAGRICIAEVIAFVDGLNHPARPRRLIWKQVRETVIPLRMPWGRSTHINRVREQGGAHLIEMQTGDEIRIEAESVEFE